MDRNLKRKKGRRKVRISRLSLKISSLVATTVLVLSAIVSFFIPGYPFWLHVAFAAVTGLITYIISHQILVARITLARTTLRQIRKRQFENLERAHLPRGDELNALIWQVYRAGLAMEKEMGELRKVENYRREFLGNVSHELKTPIFTIQGFTETLLDGALEDPKVNKKFLTKIIANARRLQNLANDLVEISRIETGELEMIKAPFRLSNLVFEVVDELEAVASGKDVTIARNVAVDLPQILGDRARISQVLVNLIDNAIKYSNTGGTVEISARRLPSNAVKVSVADDGIGIAPQHISRLTERFYRVDKSRSRGAGWYRTGACYRETYTGSSPVRDGHR